MGPSVPVGDLPVSSMKDPPQSTTTPHALSSVPPLFPLEGDPTKWQELIIQGEATLATLRGSEPDWTREKDILQQMNQMQDDRKRRGIKSELVGKKVWQELHSAVLGGKQAQEGLP